MASRRGHDTAGTVAAAGFAALAAFLLIESREMSAMGSVFPTTISIAMLVLSLAVIARNLLATRPARAVPDLAGSPESTPRRLAFMAAMAAWVVLIPLLGFYVASLLAFAAILVIASHEPTPVRGWALLAATGLVIVTGFTLLMSEVLLIPLPRGLL